MFVRIGSDSLRQLGDHCFSVGSIQVVDQLLKKRYEKFRKLGNFAETKPSAARS